jgi:hypothetical protein
LYDSLAQLGEYERAERERVVPFKRGKRPAH